MADAALSSLEQSMLAELERLGFDRDLGLALISRLRDPGAAERLLAYLAAEAERIRITGNA